MTVEGVLSFRKRDMAVGIGHMLSLPVRKAVGDRRDTGIGVVAQPSESQSGDRLKVSGIKDREIDIVVVTAPHDNSRRQIAVDTHLNIVAGCAMAGGQDVGVPDVDTRAAPYLTHMGVLDVRRPRRRSGGVARISGHTRGHRPRSVIFGCVIVGYRSVDEDFGCLTGPGVDTDRVQ